MSYALIWIAFSAYGYIAANLLIYVSGLLDDTGKSALFGKIIVSIAMILYCLSIPVSMPALWCYNLYTERMYKKHMEDIRHVRFICKLDGMDDDVRRRVLNIKTDEYFDYSDWRLDEFRKLGID